MRAVRAKQIRRAFREELKAPTKERWIAHPDVYVNVRGEKMLKYKMQHVREDARRLVQVAKQIYKRHGLLPR